MTKYGKRLTALILCLALAFTMVVQVSANETGAEPLQIVRADRVYNPGWTEKAVLVLTFNSTYTAVGETPTVTLMKENGETRSVDPQQIRQAVYMMDNIAYPQVFVAANTAAGTVSVGAGAFRTADGTPSPATEQRLEEIDFWKFHIFCRSDGVTAANRLLEGKSVTLSFEPARKDYVGYVADKFLAALWAPYIRYADNGTPVGATFTPQGRGAHTFTARLNDFVSDYIPLEVAARYQTFPDVWNQYVPLQLYGLVGGLAMFFLIPILDYLGAGLEMAGLLMFWKCSIGFWHGLFVRGDEAELYCKHQYGTPPEDRLSRSYTSRDEYRYGAYGL